MAKKKNGSVPNGNGGERVWYNVKTDRIFKTVFLNDDNYKLLECLLSECIEKDVKVYSAIAREMDVDNTHEKVKFLDCVVEADGIKANVEVNTEIDTSIKFRNFVFFSKMFSTDIRRGDNYREVFSEGRSYLLININFNQGVKDRAKRTYQLRDDETGELYFADGIVKIYDINIDNFKNMYYNNSIDEIKKYTLLTSLDLPKDVIDDFNNSYGNTITKEVSEKVKHLNEDYSYINEISMKEENEAIEAFRLREAKDKGVKEGIERGAEQRSIENATNLYQLGVDDDTIIKGTGISKEQLEEIKKNN